MQVPSKEDLYKNQFHIEFLTVDGEWKRFDTFTFYEFDRAVNLVIKRFLKTETDHRLIDNDGKVVALLERDVLQLSLGLGEPFETLHTIDEIAEILNESKEIIEINLATGMKRMRDICDQEKLRQQNEDAYNEIRLQMHNRVIKKLRLLKEEWGLENISQVTERIMLAFFKNDI
jgi:hypothetical protein